jgi:N6-adenosine-specific RNA methylase IME4/transposase-like protein
MSDVPPTPTEVLASDRVQYQLMNDLSDDEYKRLAEDIRENGVTDPVTVDDRDRKVIIDGHHREAIAKHYDLPKEKQPDYDVKSGLSESEKKALSVRLNLIGRDTTESEKSDAVENYITEAWNTTDDGELVQSETQGGVADDLGVVQSVVSEVFENIGGDIIKHARFEARNYYEANPDASYREVSREVDAVPSAVTRWLKEDFNEGGTDDGPADEQQTFGADDDSDVQPDEAEDDTSTDPAPDPDRSDQTEQDTARDTAQDTPQGTSEEPASEEPADSTTDDTANATDETDETEPKDETEDEPGEEIPDRDYDVVYANPPWQRDYSKTPHRDPKKRMGISEVKALDVPAKDDSVVYLWTPALNLVEAIEILRAWGFDYSTSLIWEKEDTDMGYWSQLQHEHLLIGTAGDVTPPEPSERPNSMIGEYSDEHSGKMEAAAELIADQHGDAELIELFSRAPRDGWDSWEQGRFRGDQ